MYLLYFNFWFSLLCEITCLYCHIYCAKKKYNVQIQRYKGTMTTNNFPILFGNNLRCQGCFTQALWVIPKLMYVQGGTEIQVVYPTDLYLSTILLQFEQSVINICTKIYNVGKNYKDLVWHIFYWKYVGEGVLLMIQKCKL